MIAADSYATLDFYTLLQVSRDASPSDIKIAYHCTLLRLHPDKRSQPCRHVSPTNTTTGAKDLQVSVDMALLKEAYRTLSDVGLRAAYDGSLRREEQDRTRSCGPRPAQVVSLEEFTTVTRTETNGSGSGTEVGIDADEWWYQCRCGGVYRITQDDLESGTHLVCCESCSEAIWVGYEEAPVTDDEED